MYKSRIWKIAILYRDNGEIDIIIRRKYSYTLLSLQGYYVNINRRTLARIMKVIEPHILRNHPSLEATRFESYTRFTFKVG